MSFSPADAKVGRRHAAHVTGHLGEFLQGRLGSDGPVVLITLPCPVLGVTVWRRPGAFRLGQAGGHVLAPSQVRALVRALGLPLPTGHYALRTDMPLGGGAGSSTAALLALAHHLAPEATPGLLARACLAAEGASDPLMHHHPGRLLWASRQGRVLARYPALPRMEVLGGFLGQTTRTDPEDDLFPDISDLVARWPEATAKASEIAALASESARRTLDLRAPRSIDPTETLAADLTALGHAIGHTGSARALLFAPGTVPPDARARCPAAGLTKIVQFRV